MDEFFRRRSKSKPFAIFMIVIGLIGILLFVAGFYFLSRFTPVAP
jgi:hypothetical protein